MRLVIDCNVLISAALNDGTARKVFRQCIEYHTPVVSSPVLAEYRIVMQREKFAGQRDTLSFFYESLLNVAIQVKPVSCPFTLPDKNDELYLATALSGNAEVIVTGNVKDFPEMQYGLVRILKPRDFLGLG